MEGSSFVVGEEESGRKSLGLEMGGDARVWGGMFHSGLDGSDKCKKG